jgi:hypothetical protein
MNNSKKYPFNYGDVNEKYNKEEAIEQLKIFTSACVVHGVSEIYHLYFHHNIWHIIADSVKDTYGIGELIYTMDPKDIETHTIKNETNTAP